MFGDTVSVDSVIVSPCVIVVASLCLIFVALARQVKVDDIYWSILNRLNYI